jgi:hypothetical protein
MLRKELECGREQGQVPFAEAADLIHGLNSGSLVSSLVKNEYACYDYGHIIAFRPLTASHCRLICQAGRSSVYIMTIP